MNISMYTVTNHEYIVESDHDYILEVTDGRVVRAGVSVTWNVLSWSGGYEFESQLGWTLGA